MENWKQRNRPVRLEKRFEFENYELTRDFLDRLGDHSEAKKRFPDISFGKNYVNITIRPVDDDSETEMVEEDHQFAKEIDGLIH